MSKNTQNSINANINENASQNGLNTLKSDGNNLYQYVKSDNTKIDNLRKSVETSRFNNSIETHNLVNLCEKLITEKDYTITFEKDIKNKQGKIVEALVTNENGEVEIKVNPNSSRAGEFLILHELSHTLKTSEMIKLVNDFANTNKEFSQVKSEIEARYGKNMDSEEVFADVCGELFGNQEFINSLQAQNTTQSRNFIKTTYETIKRLLNSFTQEGRYKNFVSDLEKMWREAYVNTTKEEAISNINGEIKYSQKTLKDGTKYIQTEKNLFTKEDGTPMSQREVYNSLIGRQIKFNDGITATIKQWLPNNKNMYSELFKRYPNYKNVADIKNVNSNINENIIELLENSKNISSNEPDYMGRHKDNKIGSFDTRRVSFYDGKNAYDLDFSIAQMQDGTYVAYAKRNLFSNNTLLNKIKKEAPTSKSRGVLPYVNNIPQNDTNVKSDTSTKYSMQENINNTQEIDNNPSITKEQIMELYGENKKTGDHETLETIANLIYDCKDINDTNTNNMIMVLRNTNLRKGYSEIKIKNESKTTNLMNQKTKRLIENSKLDSLIDEAIDYVGEDGRVEYNNYGKIIDKIDSITENDNIELNEKQYELIDKKLGERYENEYYVSKNAVPIETQLNNLKNDLSDFVIEHNYFKEMESYIKHNIDSVDSYQKIQNSIQDLKRIENFVNELSTITTPENISTSRKSVSTYITMSKESLNNPKMISFLEKYGIDPSNNNDLNIENINYLKEVLNENDYDEYEIRISDHNSGSKFDFETQMSFDYNSGNIFVPLYKLENTKYSEQVPTWQEHLEKNYKATGTRTDMRKLLLPTSENNTKSSIPTNNINMQNNKIILKYQIRVLYIKV